MQGRSSLVSQSLVCPVKCWLCIREGSKWHADQSGPPTARHALLGSLVQRKRRCCMTLPLGSSCCNATGAQAVLVVDTSLKMSVGKTAAQCAHAAVGVFKNMHINAVPWLQSWEVSCTFSVSKQALYTGLRAKQTGW